MLSGIKEEFEIRPYPSLQNAVAGVLLNIFFPPLLSVIHFAIGVIGILLTPFLFLVPKRFLSVLNSYEPKKMPRDISKLERINLFFTTSLELAVHGTIIFLAIPYFWLIKVPGSIILTIKTGFPHIPSIEEDFIPHVKETLAKYQSDRFMELNKIIAIAKELHNKCHLYDRPLDDRELFELLPDSFRENEQNLYKAAMVATLDEPPATLEEQRKLFLEYIAFIESSLPKILTKSDTKVEAAGNSPAKPVGS